MSAIEGKDDRHRPTLSPALPAGLIHRGGGRGIKATVLRLTYARRPLLPNIGLGDLAAGWAGLGFNT